MSGAPQKSYWGIVLNGNSDPTPNSPPVTPITCHGRGIYNVLGVPVQAQPNGTREEPQISPQKDKRLAQHASDSASASTDHAPANAANQRACEMHSDQGATVGSLRQRRAQKSGRKSKQLLLLQPPVFKRGYQGSMRNAQLIRRLLTSEAPEPNQGSESNPHRQYR